MILCSVFNVKGLLSWFKLLRRAFFFFSSFSLFIHKLGVSYVIFGPTRNAVCQLCAVVTSLDICNFL